MADELGQGSVVRGVQWREVLPFTHLFRGFRVAIHPSKLVLGLILLLLLYTGGRILDGLWNERDLAVPDELQLYEDSWEAGNARNEFARMRGAQRLELEHDYADRLVEAGIYTDVQAARAAAVDGDRLDALAEKIVEERDARRASIDKRFNDELNAATRIQDTADRERAIERVERTHDESRQALYREAYEDLKQAKLVEGVGLFHMFFEYEAQQVVHIASGVLHGNWGGGWSDETRPGVFTAIRNMLIIGPAWLMQHHPLYFVLFVLMFLMIWAIFGGAIARIAAVHVARDEKLGVRAALQFSIGKFLSFISAPLIPLIIVLVVGLIPLLSGLLASIPYVGPVFNILMGLLFVLLLACGFVMTLVLVGTLGGFNLMYPTIAVEGSDSFDAISRSFSYVYARPWRMAFYTIVSVVYWALTYFFVRLFVGLMLALTHYFVGAGMFKEAASSDPLWSMMWPLGGSFLTYDVDYLTLRWDQDLTSGLISFWFFMVVGLLGAYIISFYFSANTIIYFLMRREVDATEMDDIYLEATDEDFGEAAPVIAGGAEASGEIARESQAREEATEPAPPAPAEPPQDRDQSNP